MSTRRAFLAAAVLGCSIVTASAAEGLSRVWTAPSISVQQRAAAVNRAFTNGTPMSVVVAALGTNYTRFCRISTVWMGPGPEPRKTSGLTYRFGQESVIIRNRPAEPSGVSSRLG